jgi:hypothetical protein
MHTRHLFEYAVIRVMPRVEREEFINVGVILYCAKPKFLQAIYTLDEKRLSCFATPPDFDELVKHLCMFEHICQGVKAGGPIALLDAPSRFRWLTATRSTVLQTSKVHPGLCIDPLETLNKLHQQLVL